MANIRVLETEISIYSLNDEDYICITDIARYKDPENTDDLIRNWIRNRNTVEFLGIRERPNNPDFKPVEFDGFRKLAGLNSFTLTHKQWIEKTHAVGLISKSGRKAGFPPCLTRDNPVISLPGQAGRSPLFSSRSRLHSGSRL
ncbi:KilA-N domain-containing protein [Methanoregula sp.]|jgi:KilA-N domain|uniref:KilA-N domain-containing protein n=1 Tax=Methanoregula sp. TaxID=2052170 RepID=UPI003C29A8CB